MWSYASPLMIEGNGWRFGLYLARFGIETWDPALSPPGSLAPGGPWYYRGFATDLPPLRWCDAGHNWSGVRYFYVTILPLVPLPLIISLVQWPRTTRTAPGLCPSCGYDRRGIEAKARCPECAQVP